jgi:hypothetical protein
MILLKPGYHYNNMFICNISISQTKKIANIFLIFRLSKQHSDMAEMNVELIHKKVFCQHQSVHYIL